MWLAVMMVCTGPDIACYPGWSGSNVFETEVLCKEMLVDSLAERIVTQTIEGKEIVFIDGQCVYFDYILPKGEVM